MFHSARLKLTAWYLLIIMTVSLLFSIAVYSRINLELRRFERMPIRVRENLDQITISPPPARAHFTRIDPKYLMESRERVIESLIFINLLILVLAGAAGYFLAGRTLRPIQEMVDEQNRFITDASHELRTPITSLKSEIEVNLRDRKLNLEKYRKILESNLEEVNHLQVLSDELIRLAQDGKTTRMKVEKVFIGEVVSDAITKVKKFSEKKHIAIKNSVKDLNIQGDRASLSELFIILLDNAIKYSPTKSEINISSEKSGDKMIIKIKDKGIGIAEEDLPYIFNRFFRGEKSHTTEGYGLGLSIAKKIVDAHKGAIAVKNNPGKGTTFTIMLPISKVL
jgi:signal transduction histidine kinase